MSPDLGPLLRYWRAQDDLFARVEPAWWGAVVSDPRFPRVQEPNYARVETRQPVRLAEVEEPLVPALAASGCAREHVVVFHPDAQTDLVAEASTRGDRIAWDLVMEHRGRRARDAASSSDAPVEVHQVAEQDDAFWSAYRSSLRWFDVTEPEVVDELAALERDTMIPAGRRWFAVRRDGAIAALAALLVLEGVGYLDHVVTFPDARRRGFARALALRAVAEASGAGAGRTYLLAERNAPAVALYRSIGFRPVTSLASWLRPLADRR